MAETEKVRVGIAGLGRSGWDIHARFLGPLGDKYGIVAALDSNPARLKEAADKFGCRTYSAYDALLADKAVELVVVAVPSHLHADYTVQALKAGKHVVCEKPMAGGVKDADRMIAAAKKASKVLTIFQNRRYAQDFLTVRGVIESGVLGRIVHVRIAYHGFSRRWDWQTLEKYGGGSLSNAGPHSLDQALVLFGEKKPRVFCLRDRALTLGDADDHAKVILYGPGSPTIEIEITAACPYRQDTWLIMGTRGGLTGTESSMKWKYFDPETLPKRVFSEAPTPDRSYNSETLLCVEKSWTQMEFRMPGEPEFYLDLYETIRNRRPLQIKPEQVRLQIQVLEQCKKMAPLIG
ncbi:MAG: Gfo/Idh/MocA family oxidoreductase [Verrucomicrobiota bacterium]|nr:Gfo/Idh/MocA family oxidoreductase [Verrucomicrobiota bacterium]